MKIFLLIFTLCRISDGGDSNEVTGYSGGGVLIKCKYQPQYKQNNKYFCKGSWPGCSDQIRTKNKDMWGTSGRFSLFDDTESAEFSVMIRNVAVDDAGTYQCGIDQSETSESDLRLDMELFVQLQEDLSIGGTVHVGPDLEFICNYPQSLRNKATITFSLRDDREGNVLSVIIHNSNEQDAGELWCGAETGQQQQLYISLTVTAATTSSLLSPSNLPDSAPTVISQYTLITVFVVLLLFVIGISLHTLIMRTGNRIKAGKTFPGKCSAQVSGNNHDGSFAGHEPAATIYCNSLFHTNPSDSAFYYVIDPPTSPPDQDIYSTVGFPTFLSAPSNITQNTEV